MDHILAVFSDGSPAWCTCGETRDLLAHAATVLPEEPN